MSDAVRAQTVTEFFGADQHGWFGDPGSFGGRFMPEALIAALDELDVAWQKAIVDPAFVHEFEDLLQNYAGVPSMLYEARRLSEQAGACLLYTSPSPRDS